jgi:mono/diheme cytochrome c family protein
MAPRALLVLFLLSTTTQVSAQSPALNDTQALGKRLYEQSCGVCHTPPTLVSRLYGPALSKDSAGGRAEVMREVISNGTPRMPGFKYTYSPDQIAAIAVYLETLPAAPAAQAAPAPAGSPPAVRDN